MVLAKVGRLAAAELPVVLLWAREHSQAGVASLLSERKGLITDQDVLLVLRRCKANLLQRVVEKDVRDQSKEAKQLARMIAKVFPPLIEEDNEVMNEKTIV